MDLQRDNCKISLNINSETDKELSEVSKEVCISKSLLIRLLINKSLTEIKQVGIKNLEFSLHIKK
jgi:hypothetical protein